ncbi:MAG TPA: hypothetical protein VF607_05155, partial [Verrucomicrobiae bacterium]
MNPIKIAVVAIFLAGLRFVSAQVLETVPPDPYFAHFAPVKAPEYHDLLLQPGDRLAIIGDSITEQK